MKAISGSVSIVLLILTCLVPLGCSKPTPIATKDFRITIRDFYGAEGYWFDYEIVPDAVRVKHGDDYDNPITLVYESNLVSEQREELAEAIARLNPANLNGDYSNPNVADGIQITFEISINQSPLKRVFVGNTNQGDLQELVRRINRFIPEVGYRIREEWEPTYDPNEGDEATTRDSPATQDSDSDS